MVKRMVCPKCGRQGKPNDRFCSKCGMLLVEKEVEDTGPNTNETVNRHANTNAGMGEIDIKSMFSKQALEEIENLDESIAYIMNCYKGELKSVDKSLATDENLNGKNRKVTIKADYTVITDEETYNLFFIEKSNTESPDENGLYMIWLSKESEKEKYQGNYGAGIHFPED